MAIVRKLSVNFEAQPSSGVLSLEALINELKEARIFHVPLNVHAVAEYLGVEVVEELMDDDISGYLEFKSGRWFAGINALHHENRQRFTLAHELGHFVLHRNSKSRFVDQTFARREGARNSMESEADSFAAQLLMPENDVRLKISQGITDLRDLAATFRVSSLAMRYRVRELGFQVK